MTVLICRSDDNLDLFPLNNPWHFSVRLPSTYICSEIALLDFDVESIISKHNNLVELYIHLNTCTESFVGNSTSNLLRRVLVSTTHPYTEVRRLVFIPVNTNELTYLDFTIRDRKGVYASFLIGHSTVSLI